jgi:hypothetical protein
MPFSSFSFLAVGGGGRVSESFRETKAQAKGMGNLPERELRHGIAGLSVPGRRGRVGGEDAANSKRKHMVHDSRSSELCTTIYHYDLRIQVRQTSSSEPAEDPHAVFLFY